MGNGDTSKWIKGRTSKTTWTLGKIIFPITILVVILQHTPVLPWIIKLIAPFMGIFGLSGEAAIPLVLGNALNLYAGIAGILSLGIDSEGSIHHCCDVVIFT